MRLLTETETSRVAELSTLNLPLAMLELTQTGHTKGIMDATDSVRRFFKESGIHDYLSQPKGEDSKHLVDAFLLRPDGTVKNTKVSMYRPQTKDGDPRVWVYGLAKVSNPADIICLSIINGELWVVDVSNVDLNRYARSPGQLDDALAPAFVAKTNVVDQLTQALLEVFGRGFIAAPGPGDTMVGRVLESALGIDANSRKAPDYHGIELKAYRLRSGGRGGHAMKRRNLFAKTPDWSISYLKSSRQILDAFGYDREGVRKLYCEVRANRDNTQGLRLVVDHSLGLIRERSNKPAVPDVVTWQLLRLEHELSVKHAETFWIGAESKKEAGIEYFRYSHVEHTQKPLTEQFAALVDTGAISIDHLIKEKGQSAQEKGPLFKIDNASAELLFPSPRSFRLTS
jgi:hypothetical protein